MTKLANFIGPHESRFLDFEFGIKEMDFGIKRSWLKLKTHPRMKHRDASVFFQGRTISLEKFVKSAKMLLQLTDARHSVHETAYSRFGRNYVSNVQVQLMTSFP